MIKKLILRRKSGFTLIELIVTIAVLGILVLIAAPRILGYTEKAQLTRIQHDVKIMEQEMELASLDESVNEADWVDNNKDLGKLILSDKLYEKEGFASNIEKSHLAKYYENSRLGTGGDLYALTESSQDKTDVSVSLGYKIIPQNYSSKIKTKLKGTFYTNLDNKVYYEHDKALSSQKDESIKACDAPVAESLGYTFEIINGKGTITKYDHREQNIVIPSAFKIEVDGEEICEPVRVIGKAAFAYGPLKELALESVVIPGSVEIIEEEAFKDNNIPNITIPSSVKVVEDNILIGNNISHIIVRGESGSSPIKEINYPGVNIEYNYGTPKDLDIIFDYNSGTIIDYSGSGGEYIEVPKFITQNGINYPVKGIAKGAYQGEGLISVILPETLERIEDYAFSGNQLIGITIPNSVIHIGNYAFSFNEKPIQGWLKGTMKTVIMKNKEQFNKINKSGDILENGLKVNLLDGNLALLEKIFINSEGNNVSFVKDPEPEEPESPKEPEPEEPEPECVGAITFKGLGNEVCDGDSQTFDEVGNNSTSKITWVGDLDNKEISILSDTSLSVSFFDEAGVILRSPSSPEKDKIALSNKKAITELIVPSGAKSMSFTKDGTGYSSGKVYEITIPKVLEKAKSQIVKTIPGDGEVNLKWDNIQRAVIIKDGIKLADVVDNSYVDKSLQPGSNNRYEILFLDEHGNGSENFVVAEVTVKNRAIVFQGITPQAWDNDINTFHEVKLNTTNKITWLGDLDNKEISVLSENPLAASFFDEKGKVLRSISYPDKGVISLSSKKEFVKLIVPAGAKSMSLTKDNNGYAGGKVYEITAPEFLEKAKSQIVTSIPGDGKISLKWDNAQRVVIIKNGNKLADVFGNSYVDKSLQPGSNNKYEMLFLDKYGNGSENFIMVEETVKNREIIFKGITPQAWDNDINTFHEVKMRTTDKITWVGDLDNKEISILSEKSLIASFSDENGRPLASISYPGKSQTSLSYKKEIVKLIVPAGAKSISFTKDGNGYAGGKIYEITAEGNRVID